MDKVVVPERQPFDVAWRTIDGLNIRYAFESIVTQWVQGGFDNVGDS